MAEEKFSELGKTEAIRRLYEESGYKQKEHCVFNVAKGADIVQSSYLMTEGIDFDLTYFPLQHLGYKSVIAATGELYAALAYPKTLSVRIGISAKLDFTQIQDIWKGVLTAAKEHCYEDVSLDLIPSANGLYISTCGVGERNILTEKRRMDAKSMDLICISGNLGAAFFGMQVLEREKRKFLENKKNTAQPDLESHKLLVSEYLRPKINTSYIQQLEEDEIIPSYGYLVNRGLSDAVRKLVRDSGLGAKIYVDKIPFAGGTFDLGKELNIDPISAAFNGGEDYRLLFTIPIGKHDKFRHDFQTFDIIGHLAKPDVGAVLVTQEGVELPIKAQGWK